MENIPNQIMGRVQTIFGVYTRIMVVLSALLAGLLVETKGVNSAIFFSSLHFIIAAVGIYSVTKFWPEKSIFD